MDKPRWTVKQVNAAKRHIKQELDESEKRDGVQGRLRQATTQIDNLADVFESEAQLSRLIYLISLLVHHERHGGLSETKVRKVAELGEAILLTNGIARGRSSLSFLYGEIHLVLSQIYRKAGDHWQAAWEQQLVGYHARKALPGGPAFQALSAANRMLRLGHSDLALNFFLRAEQGLTGTALEKARLGRIKTLRLAKKVAEATELADETVKDQDMSQEGVRELEWEFICQEVLSTEDFTPMIKSTQKGAAHDRSIYILESTLWVKAVDKRDWMGKEILVRSLSRRKHDLPQNYGQFYKSCLELENCYNTKVPLPVRIEKLGKVLALNHQLTTIDKELLVWAAAARFLARSSSYGLAALVLHEYAASSKRLSGEAIKSPMDSLGVCADMFDRSWYLEGEADQN